VDARRLPRSLRAGICFNLIVTVALLPVAGQPYDLVGLTGEAGAWLRWGLPLLNHWKFGINLAAMAIGAQGLGFILEHLGMGGAAALTTAWKLPLVAANVATALLLYDIGRRLDARQPALVPVIWLVSPVPIFVAAGFGDVEPLTVLMFVLTVDLILRRRQILAGAVIGLGVGVEYLPVLVLVVVIVAIGSGLMTKREGCQIGCSAIASTAVCFLPVILLSTGGASLLNGLGSSVTAANATNGPAVGARSSSLWLLLGGISPGGYWIIAGGVLCIATAVGLAFRARHCGDSRAQQKYFVAATGAMLLIVILLDPGALPQFSDLAFGGLCLLAVVICIPAWTLIIGPALQLLTGIIWVYGGSFESFWYDMWARTGDAGWSFPQSATVATWAGVTGVAVIVLGLILANWDFDRTRHTRMRMPVFAMVTAIAGSLFVGIWSAQPAYWQGVGSNGASVLPDFALLTASPVLPVRFQHRMMTAELPRRLWSLPKQFLGDKKPYISLSVGLNKSAGSRKTGYPQLLPAEEHVSLQPLDVDSNVTSLWVKVLVGRSSWSSPGKLKAGQLPVLLRGHDEVKASGVDWIVSDWAILTYALPIRSNSPGGHLLLRLRGGQGVLWNGSRSKRWVVVAVRSMRLRVVVNGAPVEAYLWAPSPSPYGAFEQAGVIEGLSVQRRLTVRLPKRSAGDLALRGANLHLPLSVPLDARTGPAVLVMIGVVDMAGIGVGGLGGGWLISAAGKDRKSVKVAGDCL